MSLFGKKKSIDEQMADSRRDLKRNQRDLDRERRQLEREEQKLMGEIKAAARRGDKSTAQTYAKELVRVRNQKQRLTQSKAQLGAISHRTTTVKSTHSMAKAMEGAGKAMAATNKAMSPQKMQATMRSFQVAQERMEMTDEMLDDMFNEDDSEEDEQTEEMIGAIFDEINVDLESRLTSAPRAAPVGTASLESDPELAALMRQLDS
mmetsp:Transcript_24599/g.61729  ORF Transcript_24599/g.61729 Transcript_24599/m.61729 type:complete len:206 (-) Transcript_24599:133-750(-)|eukprot:CAMPEP_0177653014 /NCGR_PEP_ID=MMETSP0447-20121125/13481_1 /TAXON_ID=0 /ORGANISM="Stygamoeba regulata, Strain BSH-02190019" /LENGTH=205 /DNA_ID=CAMNT_0019156385 /DNA_START=98 /DNA_END=715 /DNA_ORIENTATION=-